MKIVRKKNDKQVLSRVIMHHLFKNVTAADAEKSLATKEVGDFIIRPSSSSYDNLTLSIKFYDNLLIHVNIGEEDKPNKWSLGRKLKIGNDIYDDLNEIIVTFVDPMIMYSQNVVAHPKYKTGNRHQIETFLTSEKYKDTASIPYAIGIAHEFPGRFALYYQPKNNCCREFITPTAKGLRFRGNVFRDLEELIRWFKRHYKDQRHHSGSGRNY